MYRGIGRGVAVWGNGEFRGIEEGCWQLGLKETKGLLQTRVSVAPKLKKVPDQRNS